MNAKQELLHELNTLSPVTIKCATISVRAHYENPFVKAQLKVGGDLTTFLNQLDFDYDDGYGIQELYGIVWLSDGTWLSRGEYDGSEWWVHCTVPQIPPELLS
jgi:hypothetical protein